MPNCQYPQDWALADGSTRSSTTAWPHPVETGLSINGGEPADGILWPPRAVDGVLAHHVATSDQAERSRSCSRQSASRSTRPGPPGQRLHELLREREAVEVVDLAAGSGGGRAAEPRQRALTGIGCDVEAELWRLGQLGPHPRGGAAQKQGPAADQGLDQS
jgi:hypothetical protein